MLKGIKVYSEKMRIADKDEQVTVVEISPQFKRIGLFLDVYDEVLRLDNQGVLLKGEKILFQNIEPLLHILCEYFTIVEVRQNHFWENLQRIVDLFIIRIELKDIDLTILKKYIDIWNGKNLVFY